MGDACWLGPRMVGSLEEGCVLEEKKEEKKEEEDGYKYAIGASECKGEKYKEKFGLQSR